MPQMLVRHKIADYGKWKPLFDAHAAAQRAAGLKGGRLFRNSDDPLDIFILFEADDIQRAREFTQSPDLREVMEKAGVISKPEISFLEEIEKFSV